MDDSTRLQELAAGIGAAISLDCASSLLAYVDAMLDENTRVNLTGIRDREAAIVLHVIDSLGAGLVEYDPTRTLDLGTGNGFPGVAIASMYPEADVTLLDRTQKKVKAIERALDTADFDLTRVRARAGDAAQLPAQGERYAYTLVTSRAVGAPREVSKLAGAVLRRGGRLVLWVSIETEAEVDLPGGLRLITSVDYELPEPAVRPRRVLVYERVQRT